MICNFYLSQAIWAHNKNHFFKKQKFEIGFQDLYIHKDL